jgi:hypothetical protein
MLTDVLNVPDSAFKLFSRSCEPVSYISWRTAPVLEGAVGCLRPQEPFFRLHRYFVEFFISRKSQENVTMLRGRTVSQGTVPGF